MSISAAGIPEMPMIWAQRRPSGIEAIGANDLPRLVLRPGVRIGETDQPGACCYLIEHGLVASYVNVDENRPTCVGLAGPGDIVGFSALFDQSGAAMAQNQAIVAVQLLRLPFPWLRGVLGQSTPLVDTCLQQLQATLTEVQHVAACNARHLLPARCAHWLLRLQLRLGDMLPVTHEFLASVLGVRRAGITVTLQALQRSGAIRQQRGSIIVIDTERLRAAACSCPVEVPHPPWPMLSGTVGVPPPTDFIPDRIGPRAWIDSALRAKMTDATPDENAATARIEAVLQVCRIVMERTQELLAV